MIRRFNEGVGSNELKNVFNDLINKMYEAKTNKKTVDKILMKLWKGDSGNYYSSSDAYDDLYEKIIKLNNALDDYCESMDAVLYSDDEI